MAGFLGQAVPVSGVLFPSGGESPTFPQVRLGCPQSLVGNFRYFGPYGAGFGRRSLLAIFQFPFRRCRDRFDSGQSAVLQGALQTAGGYFITNAEKMVDIRRWDFANSAITGIGPVPNTNSVAPLR
jgi:hypothetical protein